jgi:membrane protein DedA with SNARE-associated domain
MDNFNTFVSLYGLPAIFVILLVKAIGLPIPVPADVIMLAASAQVAQGSMPLAPTFGAILLALIIGGVIQFMLARNLARTAALKYGRFMGLTAARLDASARVVKKGGPLGIGLAILIPGVRAGTVVACGVANLPLKTFAAGLVMGSTAFLLLHFFIGYVGGPVLAVLLQTLSPAVLIGAAIVVLPGSLAVWIIIRRRQRLQAVRREIVMDALEAWHEACCPVCLTLGAINRFNPVAGELKHAPIAG